MPTTFRTTLSPRTVRSVLAVALSLSAVAAGCGDDTADDASLSADACDAYATIGAAMLGDPSGVESARDVLVAGASDSVRSAATTYGDAMLAATGGDEAALEGDDVSAAMHDIGVAATDSCDAAADIVVGGLDFAFEGLPEQIPAGRIAIDFTNETTSGEPHEMLILRRADGADETVAELFELPEDEAMSKVIPTAVVFADQPGRHGYGLVDLEAGEYIAVCMIPTAGDGPPHGLNGMVDEFTVS